MGDLLDIRRLLDGRSLEVADQYPKGLYCLALAFAKHAEIDGDQLVLLIAEAQDADSIDGVTTRTLGCRAGR
jgi:O-phosphoseryl-tRNA(Cys) synthetase